MFCLCVFGMSPDWGCGSRGSRHVVSLCPFCLDHPTPFLGSGGPILLGSGDPEIVPESGDPGVVLGRSWKHIKCFWTVLEQKCPKCTFFTFLDPFEHFWYSCSLFSLPIIVEPLVACLSILIILSLWAFWSYWSFWTFWASWAFWASWGYWAFLIMFSIFEPSGAFWILFDNFWYVFYNFDHFWSSCF